MKKMDNKGFSLVELIIVIAIMAILVGILAPQFVKYVEQSRESSDLQAVEEVKTVVETFVADTGTTAKVTVTVNAATTGATLGVDTLTDSQASEYGISTQSTLKSSKWQSFGWEYDNFKWSATGATTQASAYYDIDGTKH